MSFNGLMPNLPKWQPMSVNEFMELREWGKRKVKDMEWSKAYDEARARGNDDDAAQQYAAFCVGDYDPFMDFLDPSERREITERQGLEELEALQELAEIGYIDPVSLEEAILEEGACIAQNRFERKVYRDP